MDFIVCDASKMPFPDNSFDIVTCRLAVHHFSNPIDQIKEMTSKQEKKIK
jgi:ubiquinone/menaquinone biosynthesis C-methylase UbiE